YDKNECQREESPHRTSKKSAAQRISLRLRATRPPAQGRGTKSVPRQGHNTPVPLERSPPASFKRLLGGRRIVDLFPVMHRRPVLKHPRQEPGGEAPEHCPSPDSASCREGRSRECGRAD